MLKFFASVSFFLCFVAVAEPQKNNDKIPAPGIPGPAPEANQIEFEVLDGTKDLGAVFYELEKQMKLQRGVGHAVAAATLATCPGRAKENASTKVEALAKMDAALSKVGPTVYNNGNLEVRTDPQTGRRYYVQGASSIRSNATISQIAAVLTCKQDERSASDMAKMLNAAYTKAIGAKAVHPDTKEELSWSKDLNTLLMVAILLK